MRTSLIITLFTLLFGTHLLAQTERPMVRKGNELFEKEKYMESEIAYRKALEKKQASYDAQYNLAGSLYKQKKFKEAAEQYQVAASSTKDPKELGAVYHNLGNSFMADKQLEKSIDAYKQSLRNDAQGEVSDKTRYNLAYAQKLLQEQQKKEQEQKDKQNKEDKDKKDQDQDKDKKDDQQKDQDKKDDKKDQEQEKKDQEKQNKDQDQKDKQDQEKQQQQATPQEISKQNAEQILNALKQDEKDIREKVELQKAKAQQQRRVEKDW